MKRYLLLRENQETGPYSKEDLRAIGLVSYDLIWEEGKSIRWMYPSEVSDLSDLPVNRRMQRRPARAEKKEIRLPVEDITPASQPPVEEPSHEPYSFEEERALYLTNTQKRFSFQNSFSRSGGLWIVGLMMILVSSAIIVKNIVENVEEGPYQEADSKVEPVAYSDDYYAPATQADPAYQNALVTEVVAIDTTARKPEVKKPTVKAIKKQLALSANAYRQGVLGGINNLVLTLKNSSEYKLDRVTVQVQYLKPNGEALNTEQFDLHSIPAHGKKVLEVPDSKRGVDVKYKIISVEPVQQKSSIRKA